MLDDGDGAYRKVGLKKPNPWGLHDMHGNVAEWVIDAYAADHYAKFAGRTVPWHQTIMWPTEKFPRVVRGGGWDSDAEDLRSAARLKSSANWDISNPNLPVSEWWHTESFDVGFRIVRPLREPSEEEKRRYWDADNEVTIRVIEQNGKQKYMLSPERAEP